MDPLTGAITLLTAITEMVREMIQGQSPEQKAKIWDWYIADQERLRKFLKIDQ